VWKAPSEVRPGQLTYGLRRLLAARLIQRVRQRHRYQVTDDGLRLALLLTRLWVHAAAWAGDGDGQGGAESLTSVLAKESRSAQPQVGLDDVVDLLTCLGRLRP
jgi:hypothetical protein